MAAMLLAVAAGTHAQSRRRNEKASDLYRGFPKFPAVVALYVLQRVHCRRPRTRGHKKSCRAAPNAPRTTPLGVMTETSLPSTAAWTPPCCPLFSLQS
uniref:Putative secreted protein n=1 Tax=Ixodes ricinus TaxID=34613 RepID=A0A6B0UDV7_IXORI